MSVIDNRTVKMNFDNSNFESNVRTSMNTLDKLKAALGFQGVQNGIDKVGEKFSAFEQIAIGALRRIGEQAAQTGEQLVKSLTIDQVSAGWSKYEDKTKSVQTIMAATGLSMEEVNTQLEKLNWFTDETSYSFTDMVNNIGKFTSAGVDLDVAVTAMQGIATEAALSGQGAAEASRAMYNLAQALGSGTVRLQDWMSIENANMATKEFKNTIIDTAKELGVLDESTTVTAENFRETLSEKWFTSDVLIESLKKYGSYAEEVYAYQMQNEIDTASQAMKEMEDLGLVTDKLGSKAFKAAQEAKTLTDAIESVKDAASTGWLNVFENIFGSYTTAKEVWTDVANSLYDLFMGALNGTDATEGLQDITKGFKELGGQEALGRAIVKIINNLTDRLNFLKESFYSVFPALTSTKIYDFVLKIEDSAYAFDLTSEKALQFGRIITNVFQTIKNVLDGLKGAFKSIRTAINEVFGGKITSSLINTVEAFTNWTASLKVADVTLLRFTSRVTTVLTALKKIFNITKDAVTSVFSRIVPIFKDIKYEVTQFRDYIFDLVNQLLDRPSQFVPIITKISDKIVDILGRFRDRFKAVLDIIKKNLTIENIEKWVSKFISFATSVYNIVRNIATTLWKVLSKVFSYVVSILPSVEKIVNQILNAMSKSNGIFKQISNIVMSVVTNVLQAGKALIQWAANTNLVGKMFNLISKVIGPIGNIIKLIAGQLPRIVSLASNLFNSVIYPLIIKAIPIVNKLIGYISTILNKTKKLDGVFVKFGSALMNILMTVIDSVFKIIDNLSKSGFLNVLTNVIKSIAGLFVKMAPVITTVIQSIIGFVNKILSNKQMTTFIENLFNTLSKIFSVVVDIVSSIIDWISGSETAQKVISTIAEIFLVVAQTAFEVVNSFIEWAKTSDTLKKVWSSLTTVFNKISTAINNIFGKTNFLTDSKTYEKSGEYASEGLAKGLTNGTSKIIEAVKTVCSLLVNGIKKLLGIHSPSTVLEGIGKNCIDGFVIGLKDTTKITEAGKDLKQTMTGSFETATSGARKSFLELASSIRITKEDILDLVNAFSIIVKALAISRMSKSFSQLGKSLSGFFDTLSGKVSGKSNKVVSILSSIKVALIAIAAILALVLIMPESKLKTASAIIFGTFIAIIAVMEAMNLMSKSTTKVANLSILATAMTKLAATIVIVAAAIKIIGNLNISKMSVATGVLAAMMVVLTGILVVLKNVFTTAKQVERMAGLAAVFTQLAAAVVILAVALKLLALVPLKSLVASTAALSVLIIVLVAAVKTMKGLDVAVMGTALTTMAASFVILAAAILILKNIKIEILFGIVGALSALVIVMALVSKIIKPTELLAFSSSMMVIAQATLTFGAGIALLGAGLALAAASVWLLVDAIKNGGIPAFAAIILYIPKLLSNLGKGLAGFIKEFLVGLTEVLPALTKILTVIGDIILQGLAKVLRMALDLILEYIPRIITLVINSVERILDALISWLPKLKIIIQMVCELIIETAPYIVDAIVTVMLLTLKALSDHVGEVVDLVINIIIGIIDKIAERIPELLSSIAKIFSGIIDYLVQMINSLDWDKFIQSMEAIGLISVMLIALAADAALAPAALIGVLAIIPVMLEIISLFTLLGELSKIPGLGDIITDGGALLEKIGAAIGRAIGGLIGGITAAFVDISATSLPILGTMLSAFMVALDPFLNGLSGITAEMLVNAGLLTAIIGALLATELINGVVKFFNLVTPGNGGLVGLALELSAFMLALQPFLLMVKLLDDSIMSGVANLTEMMLALTAVRLMDSLTSFTSFFTGGKSSLEDFGKELSLFAPYIVEFSKTVSGIDSEAVKAAGYAGKSLAEMANSLPSSGGLWQKIVGEKGSLSDFGETIEELGPHIKAFAISVEGVDSKAVQTAAECGKMIAEFAKAIPLSLIHI